MALKFNSLVNLFSNDGDKPKRQVPIVSLPDPSSDLRVSESALIEAGTPNAAGTECRMPSVDRVVSLMPGFVYVFSHVNYCNDYTNRSVGEHLGYSSEEIRALGAQMMMHVVHPDDHMLLGDHMARIALLEGDETASLEYRVITKSGKQRWLRSVDAVFDRAADGSVLRHIGCASDVTREKEGELKLSQMNVELATKVAERTHDLEDLNDELESRIAERTIELQDAVDELEQLTYIATHDLKVPVNNLCRLGLMLGENADLLPPDQIEQIGWINDCAAQLSAKIQGLVLVAQIRLSSVLPVEPLSLNAAVTQAVKNCELTMGLSARPVIVKVPKDIIVDFARFELNSILATLLDNAVKYADPDKPLQVNICARDEDGIVSVLVRDNGTGLDGERDKDKVFGLFQRAHKEPPGSGISLYCARRMLLRRGGELTVAGTRGTGAEFRLRFAKVVLT